MSPTSPFAFKDCALITLSVGKSAQNLRELLDRLNEVPAASLWHHFFETLLRPMFDDPEYPNDFAVWAKRGLHDDVLAERLAVVDPVEIGDVELLRRQLNDILEDRLAEVPYLVQTGPGHAFYFLRSQIVVLSTEVAARSPRELGQRIRTLPTGSIFFHVVEARRRTPDKSDDFSHWLASFGERSAKLRERLASARLHYGPLSDLRQRLADAFEGVELWESAS
jgi:hypothetical protein